MEAALSTMSTDHAGEIKFPKTWHNAFLLHPLNSLRFERAERFLDSWTEDQWGEAFGALAIGHTIAITAHGEEPADVIEDMVWRSPIRLRAFHDAASDTVYFTRDESACRVKRNGKGKRKSK